MELVSMVTSQQSKLFTPALVPEPLQPRPGTRNLHKNLPDGTPGHPDGRKPKHLSHTHTHTGPVCVCVCVSSSPAVSTDSSSLWTVPRWRPTRGRSTWCSSVLSSHLRQHRGGPCLGGLRSRAHPATDVSWGAETPCPCLAWTRAVLSRRGTSHHASADCPGRHRDLWTPRLR